MQYQYLLDILKKHSPHAAVTMDQVRLDFEEFYSGFQKNIQSVVEKTSIKDDIPAFWIRHPDIEARNCMLFFHGGGFTIGSTRDHMGLCSRLSHAAET
jgi:acetyl esterase/lipase